MHQLTILDLMLPAFCECLVLVGIHSYLGLHVIRRKVIFVDLALAQVAALGTTVGFLFGMAPDSVAAFVFSVFFTFVAAAVFSVARLETDKVPQEAVIGLVYAIAAAVVILVIDRAPHGAEHIKEVMTGAILWVQWESVLFAAVAYAIIGAIHFVFRKQFLAISEDPTDAYRRKMKVRLWDFFFYMTFGVVISISVRTAGVLLVFVFLVVPAITATLITDRLRWQLVIGWTMGTVVTVAGLALSYYADMPSGPAVVAFYGLMLVVAAVVLFVARRRTMRSVLQIAAGAGVVGLVLLVMVVGGRALGRSPLAESRTHAHAEGEAHPDGEVHGGHGHDAHGALGERRGADASAPEADAVAALLEGLAEGDDEAASRLVDGLGARRAELLAAAFDRAGDDDLRLALARQTARAVSARAAAPLLLRLVREAEFPYVRAEAASALSELAGHPFEGYDPEGDEAANRAALEAMEAWVTAQASPTP